MSRLLINIRGCNGSGKSTIPIEMLKKDKEAQAIRKLYNGKEKVIAHASPKFKIVILIFISLSYFYII